VRELENGSRVGAVLRRSGHAALFVLLLAACDTFGESPPDPYSNSRHGTSGSSGFSGSGGTSFISLGGGGGVGPGCAEPAPVFTDQVVSHDLPAHRELYSWTVPEHVEELRRDKVLLIRSEQEGMGRGNAFYAIDRIGLGITPEAQLAKKLSEEIFINIRYAWPHPWATRMGWPDETYGNQLLRIVLKEEAWIARVMENTVQVFDLQNQLVPIEEALLHPDRIAAIYFVNDSTNGGPSCGGSFSGGSGGYREFILGNEAMIAEWSLATQEIRDRIESDADRVATFLMRVRSSPPPSNTTYWNAEVVCSWESPPCTEQDTYLKALAIPSDNYLPEVATLAALSDTLRADLFDPDPLLVIPGG
jgi:hypothetical protein